MKTHYKMLRNPNYIGSWDFANDDGSFSDKIVTIKNVTKEMVHDGKGGQSECCVIHLVELKPMVANATNLKQISKNLKSSFVEDWAGQKIILCVKKVKAFGEIHDAIRVSATPYVKPTLAIGSTEFENCAKALKNGYTIEKIKEKYNVPAEVEKQLTDAK